MIRSKPQYSVLEGLTTNGKAFSRVNDNKRTIEVFKPNLLKQEIDYKSLIMTILNNIELLSVPMRKIYTNQVDKVVGGYYIRKGYKTINQFLKDYDDLYLTQRQFRVLRETNNWIYQTRWEKRSKKYHHTFFIQNNT